MTAIEEGGKWKTEAGRSSRGRSLPHGGVGGVLDEGKREMRTSM